MPRCARGLEHVHSYVPIVFQHFARWIYAEILTAMSSAALLRWTYDNLKRDTEILSAFRGRGYNQHPN
jgi:hypothetical protein